MSADKGRGAGAAEEDVDGLMKKMQIAEMSKSVSLGHASASKGAPLIQTVGKLLSEKAAHEDNVAQMLGRIWC